MKHERFSHLEPRGAAIWIAALLLVGVGAPHAAAESSEDVPRTPGAASPDLDEIVFPGLAKDQLRIQLGAGFMSDADAEDSEVFVVTPGGRLTLQLPIGEHGSAETFAAFSTSEYDVNHASALFEECAACPVPESFYSASVGAQGAVQLNHGWDLILSGERWALLTEASMGASWEEGAFERSLGSGVVLALGYELPKRLRLALGAKIGVAFDGGEVSISPIGAFRWDVTPWLRLRNRGFGLELDLRAVKHLDLFVAGYRTGDDFRLRSREGLPSGAKFEDRRWQVGFGVEWKFWRRLRILAEAGAMVDRQLSVSASGEGTLDSVRVDPSPYLDLRLEFRP
jgi:hypothetical protein